ncbi:MAG: hypothetical protein MUO64_21215, partial [Anaerolineales bacterium]|nr:hypothetical protein [Anaerolineales bacterium]
MMIAGDLSRLESVRLKLLLSAWKPCGLDAPPSTRRIGAVETAPQRMEALVAGRPILNESGLPDFHGLSRGFIPRRIGAVETPPHRMEAPRAGHHI